VAVFAIGDVQGCHAELTALLERLSPVAGRDEIWFVGDLVNRGPDSLAVLRLVRSLGRMAVVTLGNHDLHLLALAIAGTAPVREHDLAAVLAAPDRDELVDWLRRQPLAHYRPEMNTLMVHAGVPPAWDPLQTVKLAREVQRVLQGQDCKAFLQAMYGEEPNRWAGDLRGHDRLRFIVNGLTRIRFCGPDGRLDLRQKGPPRDAPSGLIPWFDVPDRRTAAVRVVFGHWSTLGLLQRKNLLGLDTGCVWGGSLTAARLDGPMRLFEAPCAGYRQPGQSD
jgi:bis(5'-nucleosyl)-tetraphosphatase (symmetrical)